MTDNTNVLDETFLWCERYRPRTVADAILPQQMKDTFSQMVAAGKIPNLMLSGPAGSGKTTIARAMCEQLGIDYIVINGSMNGGIDTLRTEIKNFASTVSLVGGRKMVILDEADYLSGPTQAALRNFMEEYSANCGFILTCNFKNRIIEPLHSRCSVVEFKIPKEEVAGLAAQFLARCSTILENEGIEFDKRAVAQLIMKHFPDWRRVLNEMQRYSSSGRIDTGILANVSDANFKNLIAFVRDKKFTQVRQWVAEEVDSDPIAVMRKFYDGASTLLKPNSVPTLVLLIAKYQYQHSFVADHEINLMAFLTECMVDLEFA